MWNIDYSETLLETRNAVVVAATTAESSGTEATFCYQYSNVKKKRSPSSKKRSIQRLRDFLAKKKGQGVKPLAAQESPGTLNSAHPPSSSSEKDPAGKNKTAENTPTVPSVVSHKMKGRGVEASGVQESPAPDTVTGETPCTPPPTPVCKPREDSSSLTDLLCEAKNVVYEARDDSTGISFVKNGKREWVPIVVTEGGREMSVAELKKCKRIVYFEEGENHYLSLRLRKFQFPTPIARRTRSQLTTLLKTINKLLY